MEKEYKNLVLGCQNCSCEFTIEPDDFSFYEKMKVPPPTFCPECRFQRRSSWRNDFSLYSRQCYLCKGNIVSMYSSESGINIFCNKCWWGDKWEGLEFGQDFDFNQDFFFSI